MTRKQQYDRAIRDITGRIHGLRVNEILDLRVDEPIIYGKLQDFFQFWTPDSAGNHTFSDLLNLLADTEVVVSINLNLSLNLNFQFYLNFINFLFKTYADWLALERHRRVLFSSHRPFRRVILGNICVRAFILEVFSLIFEINIYFYNSKFSSLNLQIVK